MTTTGGDPLIDAYAHVGLPRFQSISDYQGAMAQAGVDQAVLCAFDSCPDLAAIHAAVQDWPDTFRAVGVPLGADEAEIRAAADAQLAAGFSGLRLSDADVLERAWLLDLLGREGRVAVVCGQVSEAERARVLLTHLERHPDAVVVGGHFAAADKPQVLAGGPVRDLFGHPRFRVVFSRQGGYPAAVVREWADAVVGLTGWDRILWGSEAPILFWRNETLQDAIGWVEQLSPTADQRAAFFGGNARQLYFGGAADLAPLKLPFDPWDRAKPIQAGLWASGLPVEQSLAGRLVHGWRVSGGQGTLGDYTRSVLDRALPPLEE
jgi:predicted TIM-barrel fold metal-dependent hydrolase